MADLDTNYAYWDAPSLIDGFNEKSPRSFFASETRFLQKMDVPSLAGVLDVGCSCGRFYDLLSSLGFRSRYIGVDISEASIQICRKNYPALDFYAGNYLDYRLPSTCDLINATGVVQHEPHYPDLIAKMVRESSRYVLFDVKLCNTAEPVVDIERCYCEIGSSRIHMICFGYRHLLELLLALPDCGEISLFGYPTPPNSSTHGPEELIRHWVSCGVLIDKAKPGNLVEIDLPESLDRC